MHDGERRRTFRVPSGELRGALDRFRMRRSLRPVPDPELAELTRIIQARVSDPDIFIPTSEKRESDPPEPRVELRPLIAPTPPPIHQKSPFEEELDAIIQELDGVRRPATAPLPIAKTPSARNEVVGPTAPVAPVAAPVNPSISGGRSSSEPAGDLPRYVQVLRDLVRNGGWLGTTSEISSLTGDNPEKVIACLRKYCPDLARDDIGVAPIETKEGWRWLAVDLHRLTFSQRTGNLPSAGR
ncbi:MAG TPA: hypothetical protein VGG32_02150 [Thermoplasmata archaeon]|jgi:hypothetical protein